MEEKNFSVSIVITAYNVEKFIKEAVDSALNQTYKNIEVVVVDDKSTDTTPEILKSFGDRIKVITNEVNVGAGASRRIGIQGSNGEYVLLLDGDDWIDNNLIEELVNEAAITGAEIVSGGLTINHEDGVIDTTNYGRTVTEGIDKVIKFWGSRMVVMNNKIIHRRLHNAVPYCTRRYIEDTPVIIPQLALANKVAYIPNCGYHYRMNSNSLTHTADIFKTTLYRMLCVHDLITFFKSYDESYLKTIPISLSYRSLIDTMKKINPTKEMIAEHQDAWNQMSINLLTSIN